MIDYKRIYQAKVRDMSYCSRKTMDSPSKMVADFIDGTDNRITECLRNFKKLEKQDRDDIRYWCKKKGYTDVIKFVDAFGLR